MAGMTRHQWDQVKNHEPLKVITDNEDKELSKKKWREEVRKFDGKAEEMEKDHGLVERAIESVEGLVKRYGNIQQIPRETYDEISDETGYQTELIAAVFEREWRKVERKTMH